MFFFWRQRSAARSKPTSKRATVRPCLENLEERATPATITVTTTSDAVAANFVTLREAIQSMNAGRNIDANVNADVTMNAYGTNDTILFAIPNGGQVIQPTVANGELPAIAKAVTIDGGNAVKIDGGLFLPANKINGLTVTGSASRSRTSPSRASPGTAS